MVKKGKVEERVSAKELAKHENEWVALVCTSGAEKLVGSGKRIGDAKKVAEANGYPNATFMKVPSAKKAFIATFF